MTEAIAASAAPRFGRVLRAVSRVLGTVLMGVAVGLLSYYVVTDVVAGLEQQTLRRDLHALGPVGSPGPASDIQVEEGPVLDFENWEAEDRAYWLELEVGEVFGRLVSPRMGLDAAVVKGVTTRALTRGPGWAPTTDLPGPTGNCGISGHRTTYRAPFRRIDRLKVGDVIELYSPFRRYSYRVVSARAVRPWQTEVFDSTATSTLTLTACHPPYSARYRYVVQAELFEVRRLADAP